MKKRILISAEQKDALVGSFFQKLGFELCLEDDGSDDYAFVVDECSKQKQNIPCLSTKDGHLVPRESVNQYFFDASFLKHKSVSDLLEAYFSFSNEFDLVERYSQKFKNIYTIKMHDSLNLGHLIDIIVVEAYKNQFDYESIRDTLNLLLRKSLKITERQMEGSQIDLSFSYSDIGFAIQFTFSMPPALLQKEVAAFKEMFHQSHFYEFSYSKKRERLVISSLWFKEEELKTFRSNFFSEKMGTKSSHDSDSTFINVLDQEVEFARYQVTNKENDQSKRINLARKFCFFIKKVRKTQEDPIGIDFLTIEDIDTYLAKYPKKEALASVDLELKNFILKMLKDESLYESVSEYVTRISHSNLNPFVEEVQRILGEKTLEDISEIFKIKGMNDLTDESIRIKGITEIQNDEEWKIKKLAIIDRIKDEVTNLKGQEKNIVEGDIVRIAASELEANIEDVQSIVGSLVEEAILNESIPKEDLEEAFIRVFSHPNVSGETISNNDKFLEQITRQKAIIEKMSGELDGLRDEIKILKIKKILPNAEEVQLAKFIELKKALLKSIEVIRNKDKNIEKLKEDHKKIVDAKIIRQIELEARIEQIQTEYAGSEEYNNKETVEKLQNENKILTAKLELAHRKINIINGNIDKQDNDTDSKKDKDILMLKNEIHMAQSSIEKYRQECMDLEYKLIQEKEKFIKVRDDKLVNEKSNTESEEALIASLATEKRALEEKLKIQVLENKKMEQKLKFTSAQLEESKKRKSSSLMNSVNTKNNDIYTKQIENLNGRMQEISTDLIEKKKEIYKLKQENVTLVASLSEMEKRLSTYEKKAS